MARVPHAQALKRCNASHLDWVRLTNQMVICDTCHGQYLKLLRKVGRAGGGTADLDLWADAAATGADAADVGGAAAGGSSGWQCRWNRRDPLLRYTRCARKCVCVRGATARARGSQPGRPGRESPG